jgi:hypothetical protein
MQRIGGFAGYIHQQGYSGSSAHALALQMVGGELARQSAMLAYEYIFQLIGISFVVCLPLVLLLTTPKHAAAPKEHAMAAE